MPILTARTTLPPDFPRREPLPERHRASPVAARVSAHAPRLAASCRPTRLPLCLPLRLQTRFQTRLQIHLPALLTAANPAAGPAAFPLSPAIADRCVVALSLLVLLATGVDAGWR